MWLLLVAWLLVGVTALRNCDDSNSRRLAHYIQHTTGWKNEGRVLMEFRNQNKNTLYVTVSVRHRDGKVRAICKIIQGMLLTLYVTMFYLLLFLCPVVPETCRISSTDDLELFVKNGALSLILGGPQCIPDTVSSVTTPIPTYYPVTIPVTPVYPRTSVTTLHPVLTLATDTSTVSSVTTPSPTPKYHPVTISTPDYPRSSVTTFVTVLASVTDTVSSVTTPTPTPTYHPVTTPALVYPHSSVTTFIPDTVSSVTTPTPTYHLVTIPHTSVTILNPVLTPVTATNTVSSVTIPTPIYHPVTTLAPVYPRSSVTTFIPDTNTVSSVTIPTPTNPPVTTLAPVYHRSSVTTFIPVSSVTTPTNTVSVTYHTVTPTTDVLPPGMSSSTIAPEAFIIILAPPSVLSATTVTTTTPPTITTTSPVTPNVTVDANLSPSNSTPSSANLTISGQPTIKKNIVTDNRLYVVLSIIVVAIIIIVGCLVTILYCRRGSNPGPVEDNVEMFEIVAGSVINDVERQTVTSVGTEERQSTPYVDVNVASQTISYCVEREGLTKNQSPVAPATSLERLTNCLQTLQGENERRTARLCAFRQAYGL